MSAYAAQYRLARALFDYLTGLDPSAVGLVQTLLSLIPNAGRLAAGDRRDDHARDARSEKSENVRSRALRRSGGRFARGG